LRFQFCLCRAAFCLPAKGGRRSANSLRFPILVSLLLCTLPLPAQESDESRGTPVEPAAAAELREQIALGESLLGKTPDRGAVLYFLATAHAQLHEILPALTQLKECIALKEGFDPAGDPAFTGLRGSPDFDKLIEQAHRDFPSVAQSRLAFTTIEKDLVPEGLAYDAGSDAFFVSSIRRRQVLRLDRSRQPRTFADRSAGLWAAMGMTVDAPRGRLWVATSAVDEMADAAAGEVGRAGLVALDLKTARPVGRYLLPTGRSHVLGDVIAAASGNVSAVAGGKVDPAVVLQDPVVLTLPIAR